MILTGMPEEDEIKMVRFCLAVCVGKPESLTSSVIGNAPSFVDYSADLSACLVEGQSRWQRPAVTDQL